MQGYSNVFKKVRGALLDAWALFKNKFKGIDKRLKGLSTQVYHALH